jgi:tripeptide aminopeptidase
MVNRERMLNQFLEMVKIDSETKNEGPFASYLVSLLESMGFLIERDQASTYFPSNTNNIMLRKMVGMLLIPYCYRPISIQ